MPGEQLCPECCGPAAEGLSATSESLLLRVRVGAVPAQRSPERAAAQVITSAPMPAAHNTVVARSAAPVQRKGAQDLVDVLLERLVEHELASLREREHDGKSPPFEEVLQFYRSTRFLYASKMSALRPRLNAVHETWKHLLPADRDLFRLLVTRRPTATGEMTIRNSVCAFEYSNRTWLVQHLVSADRHEYAGTLSLLLGLMDWLARRGAEHCRLTYRPDNPGIARLLTSLVEALGTDGGREVRRYFTASVAQVASEPDHIHVRVVTEPSDSALSRFIDVMPAVEVSSLHLEDPELTSLAAAYAAYGLHRSRVVLAAERFGELRGLAIVNLGSQGMNFSFLENAMEGPFVLPCEADPARVMAALLGKAAQIYAAAGRTQLVGMAPESSSSLLAEAGLLGDDTKQYAVGTLRLNRRTAPLVRAHLLGYYRTLLAATARPA